MTDRVIVYPSEIPLDTDILSTNRNAMIGIGYLAQMVVGTGTVVDGLAITATSVASMTVNVGPGSIAQLATIDATAYGSLAADNTDPLVKLGINFAGSTPFTLTAPTTSGQSQNYLIEAQMQESDGNTIVAPYYNSANPAVNYSGPNGTGTAQNTARYQRVALQLKPGTAAAAGTQTTPAVDSGWVGLYQITVNYGQTTITNTNLNGTVYPSAPFLSYKLPALSPGFSHRVFYTSSGSWTVPTGVTQAYVYVWGGGGGSGACYAAGSASAGGGAGGYAEGLITGLTPGSSITVTVGAAGTAGAYSSTPTAGGSGGTSSFGSSISATGGTGGIAANGGTASGVSSGGTGVGGDLQVAGGESWGPYAITSGSIVVTSAGGAAFGGPMAHSGSTSVTANGIAGHFPGGGAAGSAAAASGAVGGSGLVKITY